ncbi:hypothetical protein Ade02nite_70800 [Paractinoplanes deccanensis]|uniref:Transposase n=1 Tax=Paractinoplanes deccanensis TaxID=113561 RepID=A0ABQ3YEM1_9ACTN|nr:hypothetical protein [Actinoplanes deccanensis]GID78439.1 hypothetical protein Ade02nite_70800 [Actinoplanes deccanensis]
MTTIAPDGQEAVYLAGPGHNGPALVAAGWLGYVLVHAFGAVMALVREAAPGGAQRMSATPYANGGLLTGRLPRGAADLKTWCVEQLRRHEAHIIEYLEDMPEIRGWTFERRRP